MKRPFLLGTPAILLAGSVLFCVGDTAISIADTSFLKPQLHFPAEFVAG